MGDVPMDERRSDWASGGRDESISGFSRRHIAHERSVASAPAEKALPRKHHWQRNQTSTNEMAPVAAGRRHFHDEGRDQYADDEHDLLETPLHPQRAHTLSPVATTMGDFLSDQDTQADSVVSVASATADNGGQAKEALTEFASREELAALGRGQPFPNPTHLHASMIGSP